MIVSVNNNALEQDFIQLLNDTTQRMSDDALKRPRYYTTRAGINFEEDVYRFMDEVAEGTEFEGTINLVSGRQFPDIIAKQYYGVEVKTSSKGAPWKCVGNSVLETSRVDNIQRIYMYFGKLMLPVEFRFRKYEDCLYEVAVTHSPRYMIDMELQQEDTIFSKMQKEYDEIRQMDNPIKPFLDYYREKYKGRGDLWWLNTQADHFSSPIVIKFWSGLSQEEQNKYRIQMLALFPEIIKKGDAGSDKYSRAAAWLLKTNNVINPSFRDIFTGGGRSTFSVNSTAYKNVPTFFRHRLSGNIVAVLDFLSEQPKEILELYWDNNISKNQRISRWLSSFRAYGQEWLNKSNLNIDTFLRSELRGSKYAKR